jgi:hypothetical protein
MPSAFRAPNYHFYGFTDRNFNQYLHSQYILPTSLHIQQTIDETLVSNLYYVGESIGKKFTDRFTDKKSMPKNIYLLHFVDICHITEGIPYANFIGVFICPSV